MGYDAWNRLVTTEHVSLGGGTVLDVSAYTYNALGWRTSKIFDATKSGYDGVMEQKRVFIYDASWRIIEEHTDIDFDVDEGVDWVSQQFWGLRYIDDLVAKRVDRNADGDWTDSDASRWYFITDSQFSVVAVLDWEKHLWERIEYDAYGNARHRYAGDVNGDGRYDFFDLAALGGESAIGDANYHADFDVNFDGGVRVGTDATDDSQIITDTVRNGEMSTALPVGWIGDPSSSVGPDNSIGYAGYVFNAEREDYTVRFRVLTTELGRWRQRDPAGYLGGPTLYAYSVDNPTARTDPMGLKPGDNWHDMSQIIDDNNVFKRFRSYIHQGKPGLRGPAQNYTRDELLTELAEFAREQKDNRLLSRLRSAGILGVALSMFFFTDEVAANLANPSSGCRKLQDHLKNAAQQGKPCNPSEIDNQGSRCRDELMQAAGRVMSGLATVAFLDQFDQFLDDAHKACRAHNKKLCEERGEEG